MSSPARVRVADTAHPSALDSRAVLRVRREYEEMPGLCLTSPQIERLCGLTQPESHAALAALVGGGYLRATVRGFIRA